jgi:hypothetical protein
MLVWLKSPNGIITLVTIAMLSFIGYIFLEARFFLGQWIPGNTAAAIETLVVLAIVGGWLYAFSNLVIDKRSGLIVALILSIILTLIALFDLINYSPIPSPIPYGWPLLEISVWTMLISNTTAITAISIKLASY